MAIINIQLTLDTDKGDTLARAIHSIADNFEANKPVALAYVGGARPAAYEGGSNSAASHVGVSEDYTTDILDFLRSDPRYDYRTASAVAKALNLTVDEVRATLRSMVAEGEVNTRRRRRDGTTLYCAA